MTFEEFLNFAPNLLYGVMVLLAIILMKKGQSSIPGNLSFSLNNKIEV